MDDYPNSIHYQDFVARFKLRQDVITQSDNHCDKPLSNIYLTVESLINTKMFLSYRIRTESGPVYIYYNDEIIIEAHQTIDVGLIQTANNPPFLELGLDSISAEMTQPAYYY
jgi:hypothetical protein